MSETREVAHQVLVREQTFVGTKDSGDASVHEIKMVPKSADVIHPEVAERLKDKCGIAHPHKYDLYVADERTLSTESDR